MSRTIQDRIAIIAAAGIALLAAATFALPARAEIHCTIAPTLGITDVLGMPSAVTTMTGPAADRDIADATTTTCNYTGGTGTIVLSVIELPSPASARAALTRVLVAMRLKDEEDANASHIEVEAASGLGERAFSGVTARTAGYAALKGARILIIGASGPDLSPEALKPKVRSLMTTVLGKL